MRIGIIGVGRMGMPLCARLAEAGFSIQATDLTTTHRTELEASGARWTASSDETAHLVDVLITVLPAAPDVLAVAPDVCSALMPGALWMDMSTGTPQLSRALAEQTAPSVRLIDAPVAGTPADARVGGLLAFVGGSAADLEHARPVLSAVAARIVHVGAPGSGYLVKLLTNVLWFGQAIASAEVLTLASRYGVDLDVFREAIGVSAAQTRFMDLDADALLAGDDLASYSFARCCDQLQQVLELGRHRAVPLELVSAVNDIHLRALEYFGDVDGELLGARFVSERGGLHRRQ